MRHLRKIRVEGDTAYVPLSQGYEAVIDTADVDLVGQFNWFVLARPHTVYAARNRSRSEGPRGLALMHRLILSPPKGMTVDHINRNGLDNRRSNLRLATQAQNNANTGRRRNNTSGAKGVDWRADESRWRAQITVNGRAKFLGLFASRDEASGAYAKAAAEHFGDFAFVPHPVPRGQSRFPKLGLPRRRASLAVGGFSCRSKGLDLMATPSMIIDSFAGGGGASTGIELALGRSPDVAINHSTAALALHAANHPETLHLDSNIWDVAPREVTKGRHVGLLWASPDCKHFSKAKGGAPKDRNIRDLAWVIVRWMEEVKPDVVAMENVEEFRTWGPIDNEGQPIPEFIGQTFDDWCRRIRKAGYRMQWRELRACDYGSPTIRKRFFMVARRDGRQIVWPKPTHGDPKSEAVRKGRLLPWRTAAECIDFTLPCPSIFDTAAEIMAKHQLRAVRPLKPNTLARVARGVKRYVLEAAQPFLVNLTHGARVEAADEPFRTITGAHRGEKSLVAPSITRFNGGATGWDLRDPAPTILAQGGPLGVVAPSLLSLKGTTRRDFAADAPHPTVLAGGGHSAIVAPALATFYGHGDGRGIRSADLAEPLRTVTVENRHALITPSLISVAHGDSGGRREYPLSDPMGVVLAGGISNALIAPHVMTMRNAGKPFNGADEPAHTITAGGAGLSCVAPVLTYAQHGGAVRDVLEPVHTIAASRKDQNSILAPFFAKYYGTGDGSRADAPLHTITVKDRMAHVQADLASPTFGPEHHARAREVAEFLRAHDAWDGGEFVTLTIAGVDYVMTDIGMRMLTPRELFNAQGFPPDYVIEGVWQQREGDWHWVPFPKDVQVSCCGNSVCPDLARALIASNCQHLIVRQQEQAA